MRGTGIELHSDFEKSGMQKGDDRSLMARIVRRASRLIGTGMLLGALAAPALMASHADAFAETRGPETVFRPRAMSRARLPLLVSGSWKQNRLTALCNG